MPDTNLLTFIQESLKKGDSKNTIEEILITKGWDKAAITETFDSIERKVPTPPLTNQTVRLSPLLISIGIILLGTVTYFTVSQRNQIALKNNGVRVADEVTKAEDQQLQPSDDLTYIDCLAANRPLDASEWKDGEDHVYKCADQPSEMIKYPQPDGSCRNPLVPTTCTKGLAMQENSKGCLEYKCLEEPICAFDTDPKIVDCKTTTALHPEADFWWDQEGCFSICAGTENASWVNTPINNLCLDQPELSFTGYFPNESFYPEFYRRDGAIQKAVKVLRIEKSCKDDKEIQKYQLWLKRLGLFGEKQTYCNFICRNRKNEQCVLDGSPDSYVDEWCLDEKGNKINPDDETVDPVCDIAQKPECPSGMEVYPYTNRSGCQKYACTQVGSVKMNN